MLWRNNLCGLQFYFGLVFYVLILTYGYHTYFTDISELYGSRSLRLAANAATELFGNSRKVVNVNCAAIINGNLTNTRDINNVITNNNKVAKPLDYVALTANCSTFIKSRDYITSSLTKEEEDFPIAFSILMYKDAEQTERLLRAIFRPQNLICIHVDKKSSAIVANAIEAVAKCFDNVFLVERTSVQWGKFSVLRPELLCMKRLWSHSRTWKYFINLTGQEFPLRTNYELVQHLKHKNGYNDVGTVNNSLKYQNRWRMAGKPPHGITPFKGPVHVALSRDFVDFLLHNKRAGDFLEWCKNTKIPDETFFTTLTYSSSLKAPGSIQNISARSTYMMRFKLWSYSTCHGKAVRGICIFGTGDLPLLASRQEMFANKFHFKYGYALDCIEELHYNRTRDIYFLHNR